MSVQTLWGKQCAFFFFFFLFVVGPTDWWTDGRTEWWRALLFLGFFAPPEPDGDHHWRLNVTDELRAAWSNGGGPPSPRWAGGPPFPSMGRGPLPVHVPVMSRDVISRISEWIHTSQRVLVILQWVISRGYFLMICIAAVLLRIYCIDV